MEDFTLVVGDLAVRHRAKAAFRSLLAAGAAAAPFVRTGLRHPDPSVVVACCRVVDRFLYEEAVPDLIAVLSHENAWCRAWALHALACDRCKQGACRPGEGESVPIALALLRNHSSERVRAMAVDMLGTVVHRRSDVADALAYARDHDECSNVRKQAGLRAPGGVLYRRLSPEQSERRAARKHLKPHLARI
jgi:HEAT repeat protein